jgi:hypothetical protein
VLQALPKFRLRGVKFILADELPISLTVKMASEMRIRFNLLFYTNHLPQLLDFIANGRQLDKRLEFRASEFRSEDVDQIVKVSAGHECWLG